MTAPSNSPNGCPTPEQLQAFQAGQLPRQIASTLVEHVARCPKCVAALRDLQAKGDMHVSTMVSGGGATLVGEPAPPGKAAPRAPAEQAHKDTHVGNTDVWSRTSASGLYGEKPDADGVHARETAAAPQEALPPKSKPAQMLGDYEILEKLGAGGMGEVYKARHERMDRIVAMKVLPRDALNSPKAVERFQREVKASAKLIHPNIVAAYDAGEQDGVNYMVMEYVAGKDLNSLVEGDRPLSCAKALDYILQAARGLAHAHKKGIVHRDVKPANLILDQDGVVKVLDMGLATLSGMTESAPEPGRPTKTGIIMGTPAYMAPEQAADVKRADGRADIYSLGCVFFFLVTGRDPYVADNFLNTLLAHREQPIPSLCEILPGFPPAADLVFRRMLAKTPETRYPSASDLIRDLEALLAGRLPEGAPAAPVNTQPSGSSALGLGTGFGGMGGSGFGSGSTFGGGATRFGESAALGIPSAGGASAAGFTAQLDYGPAGQVSSGSGIGVSGGVASQPGYVTGEPLGGGSYGAGSFGGGAFGGAPPAMPQPGQSGIGGRRLADSLVASGLVSAIDMGALLGRFGGRPPADEKLLSELVRAGHLTTYQSSLLTQAQPEDLFVGDYLVTDMIAESPRAILYRAVHRQTRSEAAIKVSARSDAPLATLTAAARFQHPHIVPVQDLNETNDVVYQVLPYFPAGHIGRRVRKQGRLTVAEALACTHDMAEALAYAAERGFAHGNVGPTNMLVDAGKVLLSDFGWAAAHSYAVSEEDGLRSSGATALPSGTDLVAPELIGGARMPDQQSDIYSLGATLFYLISGIPPKWDKSRGVVPSLSEYAPDLPAGVQFVFEKMAAHDRAARFATFAEVLAALADPAALEAASKAKPATVEEAPEEPKPLTFWQQPGAGAVVVGMVVFAGIAATLGVRMAYFGAELTPWDWGRGVLVAVLAAGIWEARSYIVDFSTELPFLVGTFSGLAWAGFYYLLDLPGAEMIAELCHISIGLSTGQSVDPAVCITGFGLASGVLAGAISAKGAAFMASGVYFPMLSLAIFLSGYQLQKDLDAQAFEEDEGVSMIRLQKYKEAIEFYNRMLTSQPKRAGFWFNRGRAYEGSNDHDKALQDFSEAIKLRPKNPEGYDRRGDVHFRKKKDFQSALDDYNRSLRLAPSQPKVLTKRGEVRMELGQMDEAMADFNDAIVASNDKDPTAYLNRAKAYEKLGKPELAAADRDKAKSLFEEMSK